MTKQGDKLELLKDEIIEIKTDVKWLKKFFWIVAAASIGGWITSFMNFASRVSAK